MTLTYIAAGIILLGLCIFVHELGHLLGGKMVGIKARVFSLGFGKPLVKKQIGDTTYQVAIFPLGGYCQFYGEHDHEEGRERVDDGYDFLAAHPLKRIVAVIMGPLFNLIFGIMLFFTMNMIGYEVPTNRIILADEPSVGTPAEKAGLKDGDEIVSVNGKKINSFMDIQSAVVFSDGKEINIGALRESEEKTFNVTPVRPDAGGHYSIGVMPYGEKVLVRGVVEGGPAQRAGLNFMDQILDVDGSPVQRPVDFIDAVKNRAGETVNITVLSRGEKDTVSLVPELKKFIKLSKTDNSANVKSGIEIGLDNIEVLMQQKEVRVNGEPLSNAEDLLLIAEKRGDTAITLSINGNEYEGVPSVEERAIVGIIPGVAPEEKMLEFGFTEGLANAFVEPYRFIVYNLKGIGMLFSGEMEVRENLAGPIRIVKFAGDVAYYEGLSSFILMMAKISIILMVMNLLPIPMVDGSHIIFYTIEIIRGKPLNRKLMEGIQTVGIIMLLSLAAFVIINDISMLPFVQRLFH